MKLNKISFLAAWLFLFVTATAWADTNAVTEMPPRVYGFPIGRCVQVLDVTTPEEATKVGFEYLELALQNLLPLPEDAFSNQVARIRGIGIPALSGYGFLPADLQVIGTNVSITHVDEVVHQSLVRARKFRLNMVIYGNALTNSRKIPDGFTREHARHQFVEFMQRAAIEAQNQDMLILIEPLPPESTDLINTVAEGLDFIKSVGRPNVGLLVEYSKFVQSKEDLAVITRAAPHIRQIEIENPNGWVYPAKADEADYASFFRALKAGGYHGGFSVHGKPGDVYVDGPKAIALLRTLAATLDDDDKN